MRQLVKPISQKTLQQIFKQELRSDHVPGEEFITYYEGAMLATGILLNRTRRLYEPIQLDTLKAIWPNFHPPRSYCYLTSEQVNLTGIRHFFQETENSDRQKI